jgi:hypothetical protein
MRKQVGAIGLTATTGLECTIPLKTWLRLVLVTVTVGGGFEGVLLTLHLFHSLKGPLQFFVALAFLILFSFVIATGRLFVKNPNRTGPVLAALALQIPCVSCPVLVYQFAAGLHGAITLGTPEDTDRFGLHLGLDMLFGTNFQFRIGSYHDVPWTFGVNVVALILFIVLFRYTRSSKAQPQPEVPISSDSVAV